MQATVAKIEKGQHRRALAQVGRLARALGISWQWLLTGRHVPGFELPDLAIELQHLGIVDLLVAEARVPGAFRPPEQLLAWVLGGDLPDPRIVEAVPVVLAWNTLAPPLLEAYARAHDLRAAHRLAWLADVALTIDKNYGFPGGLQAPLVLEDFVKGISPSKAPDSLGRPALNGKTPPVSKRWNVTYAGGLDTFHQRAQHLHSLRIERGACPP
jgi:hypothetical protein